jgi:hypothetical protein
MVGEDIASVSAEVAEGAVNTVSKAMNFGKFTAVSAFASQVANSNCIGDIMMGTLLSIKPYASDKEKETIAGIAAALNLLVGIVGALIGGKIATSNIGEDLAEGSSMISSKLIGGIQLTNGGLEGGMSVYQGVVDIDISELYAAVTRLQGGMESSKELSALIGLTMNQINTLMKGFADEYKSLESNLRSIGLYDSSEVNALLKANQQS